MAENDGRCDIPCKSGDYFVLLQPLTPCKNHENVFCTTTTATVGVVFVMITMPRWGKQISRDFIF